MVKENIQAQISKLFWKGWAEEIFKIKAKVRCNRQWRVYIDIKNFQSKEDYNCQSKSTLLDGKNYRVPTMENIKMCGNSLLNYAHEKIKVCLGDSKHVAKILLLPFPKIALFVVTSIMDNFEFS